MQKAISFKVVSVKQKDYRINLWHVGKDEAINLSKNADFAEKS